MIDPGTDEARDWLRRELASGGYHLQQSALERFQEWLGRLLSGIGGGAGAPAWLVPLVVLVTLAVLGLVVLRLVRREPAAARRDGSTGVLEGVTETAAELRALARRALADGHHDEALVAAYRAVVAGATERTVLADHPGRTAHEAAGELSRAFPAEAAALAQVADRFDAVRFGNAHADAAAARGAVDLDDRLTVARPSLTDVGAPW